MVRDSVGDRTLAPSSWLAFETTIGALNPGLAIISSRSNSGPVVLVELHVSCIFCKKRFSNSRDSSQTSFLMVGKQNVKLLLGRYHRYKPPLIFSYTCTSLVHEITHSSFPLAKVPAKIRACFGP